MKLRMMLLGERWISLFMAAGLGYILLSKLGTTALLVAWAVVFLGAIGKLVLSAVAKRAGTPS